MANNEAYELNGGDDEEEALRIAIALSLGQDPPQKEATDGAPVVDLTGGDSAADVDLASMAREPGSSEAGPRKTMPSGPTNSLAALGLDRKKMEEERLARSKKRKAEESVNIDPPRPMQRMKIESPMSQAAEGGRESRPASQPGNSAALQFPKGVVKKTWSRGYPRMGDDITIEEVLQKDQLQLAVLSSFQWDDAWLLSKVNLATTKLVLVAFAADEVQRNEMRQNVPRGKIRFCFPPMNGPGSMHSKLQLLKYPGYLRIVIPTGNLVPYDWGETGFMENTVFIIDIPRIEDAESSVSTEPTPFREELCYFLAAQGMDESLVRSLGNYDFSETASYGFVHSIAGSHGGESWRRTGYCGLGRTVASLGLGSADPVDVDSVTSSLGSTTFDLLQMLYNACQGDAGLKEYLARTTRSKKRKDAASAEDQHTLLTTRVRVYFPSHETVVNSRGGRNSAGTICFLQRWWNQPSFPRDVLRDCKSRRQGGLMHSKLIFVRRRNTGETNSPGGFVYVGSANLTESAWGRLVKDRPTGAPKLTCRNWECGVVIRANPSPSFRDEQSGVPCNEWSIFDGCVPVPMELPGMQYNLGQPWFYQDG